MRSFVLMKSWKSSQVEGEGGDGNDIKKIDKYGEESGDKRKLHL